METKNKRPVIVGIFVFAALVIFVLGVMTLGGQKSIFNKGASVTAVFDEVNGLQIGNNVWFAWCQSWHHKRNIAYKRR
jgi:phospholipid/cholesterol/gamma-HCH transport system substrate-binding protein